MEHINITITVPETNLILQALGTLPFSQVAELITKLTKQAREQLDPTPPEAA